VIYAAFDHLATLVAVVQPHGQCVFANAAFESVLGLPRASVQRSSLFDWVVDGHAPNHPLREALGAVASNTYATGRLEAALRRPGIQTNTHAEHLPVHIIVNQMEGSAWCWWS
jgi:two-component system, NtrC family, nitrogen regulation sensor histidine kinase GlnL